MSTRPGVARTPGPRATGTGLTGTEATPVETLGVGVTPRRDALVASLVREARPKQWVKNLLVVAAPGAAGVLGDRATLGRTALGVVAFCLVASGTYYLNDWRDLETDRRHPVKRDRPVASGALSVPLALSVGAGLIAAGLGASVVVGWKFVVVVAGYLGLSASYTLWLKHVAVLDLAAVATGFVIRAVAGGIGARVPISQWFLIVTSFGSLFVVAGKRYSELGELGEVEGAEVRSTLGVYPVAYLRYVWMLASGVAMTAYCLWAFEQTRGHGGVPWYEVSIIPFVVAMLRYALLLESGQGSAPEELLLGDRTLQVLGVVWAAVFAAGVHWAR